MRHAVFRGSGEVATAALNWEPTGWRNPAGRWRLTSNCTALLWKRGSFCVASTQREIHSPKREVGSNWPAGPARRNGFRDSKTDQWQKYIYEGGLSSHVRRRRMGRLLVPTPGGCMSERIARLQRKGDWPVRASRILSQQEGSLVGNLRGISLGSVLMLVCISSA
jgi:hypothetical protein